MRWRRLSPARQALLEIWQKLEDVELQAAIPELEPPPPVHVITPAVEPPAEVIDEDTGIVVGQAEDVEDVDNDEP